MKVGDETASTVGIPVARFRLLIFVAGALITGVMVAFSGIIGFVGLMVPHIVCMLVGGAYLRVLPFSALVGAILLLWADIADRTLMPLKTCPSGSSPAWLVGFSLFGFWIGEGWLELNFGSS